MSIGIYKYTNKINGNSYIGQSINIEQRYQQHLFDAKNLATRKGTAIDKAIAKYGIENFTFEILEECPKEQLNEREKYWINFYDTYNNGYNLTSGGDAVRGEEHGRAILTEAEVYFIRDMYANHIARKEAYEQVSYTGITERGFKKIWDNETWIGVHDDVYTPENKEWHKKNVGHSLDQVGLSSLDRAIKQDEIDQYIQKYKEGYSVNAIAKMFHRDHGTVLKYINNPTAIKKVNYKGRKLKNINTGLTFSSISKAAKWAGCGATTLTRHLETDKTAGTVPDTHESAIWEEIS